MSQLFCLLTGSMKNVDSFDKKNKPMDQNHHLTIVFDCCDLKERKQKDENQQVKCGKVKMLK